MNLLRSSMSCIHELCLPIPAFIFSCTDRMDNMIMLCGIDISVTTFFAKPCIIYSCSVFIAYCAISQYMECISRPTGNLPTAFLIPHSPFAAHRTIIYIPLNGNSGRNNTAKDTDHYSDGDELTHYHFPFPYVLFAQCSWHLSTSEGYLKA